MIDTFRALHPARRGMSFFYSRNGRQVGAARLDRVYARDSLMPSITSSDIVSITASTDHRAVVVNLIPSVAEVGAATHARPGVRRNRVRMLFWDCSELREQFTQWVSGEAAVAPAEHDALLIWWPDFKRRLAAFVASLNVARRRQALPPAALHAGGAKLRDRRWTLRTMRWSRGSLARSSSGHCKRRGSGRLRSKRYNNISVYTALKLNGCIRMSDRPLPSLL